MKFSTILFEQIDGCAIITLNRPDKLNALNRELLTELSSALEIVRTDASIRAVIVTGSGDKAFAAGADIAELHECNKDSGKAFAQFGQNVFSAVEFLGKPVIAAVNGFALGGGCELALACHIRFASENAKFGQPEVNLGIIPGYGGTQRLSALVGRAKSAELILSGAVVSVAEAVQIGLVNAVVPKEELLNHAKKFVQTLLSKSPIALASALRCIIASDDLPHEQGMAFEADEFALTCNSLDFKEGTKAFLEKRTPIFTGK